MFELTMCSSYPWTSYPCLTVYTCISLSVCLSVVHMSSCSEKALRTKNHFTLELNSESLVLQTGVLSTTPRGYLAIIWNKIANNN